MYTIDQNPPESHRAPEAEEFSAFQASDKALSLSPLSYEHCQS